MALLTFIICLFPFLAWGESSLVYQARTGHIEEALSNYQTHYTEKGEHDYHLLEQIALVIMEQGVTSRDPESALLSLFGAGISANEKTLKILEWGLNSPIPQHQMVSLNFLGRWNNSEADDILMRAFSSPFLLIRLEAAYLLAQKKHKLAIGQVEALLSLVDPQLKPLFPAILTALGTPRATRLLRQMLHDPDEKVRLETILQIGLAERDDLAPSIRRLLSHTPPAQQEACATALGCLHDREAEGKLRKLLKSNSPAIVLAAAEALFSLGDRNMNGVIEQAAAQGYPFAIFLLKDSKESKELLFTLTQSPDLDVKLNAVFALLHHRDPRSLPALESLLTSPSSDWVLTKSFSPGRSLIALHALPLAQIPDDHQPLAIEMSLSLQEALLREAIHLPENDFLHLAETLFTKQRNALIPTLVSLLENVGSKNAIALLKTNQQKIGSPLIRQYCTLALYNLQQEGPYEDNLRTFVKSQEHLAMIRFRPFVPLELRKDDPGSYELTPEEGSNLFIQSIEALTRSQGEKDIASLLEAIQNGHPKNRYALAGLLIRAIQ